MTIRATFLSSVVVGAMWMAQPAVASDTTFTDPCIDAVTQQNGDSVPPGGEIISQSWSEAGTLVMLRDAAGTTWRCISYKDGTVGELTREGAVSPTEPTDTTQTVRFASGSSSADISGSLTSGSSASYVLGARSEQFLDVTIAVQSGALEYHIFNPDGSELLELVGADLAYRGQLFMTGDHVVEIINRSGSPADYTISIAIN